MPPSSSSAVIAKAVAASRSPRSIVQERDSGEVRRQSASTSANRSARRAQMPTVAPAEAKARAKPAPMPEDAPVTSTFFPARSYAI